MVCARRAQTCKSHPSLAKASFLGMIWGQVNLENVSKAGNPPMKQIQRLSIDV
jgi:hypothetical protein